MSQDPLTAAYHRRVADQKLARKQPLTPDNGPTAFGYSLPPMDIAPEGYSPRYPRLPAIRKIADFHKSLCQKLPAGHWENSFLVAPAPENITSKPEDLVSRPPNRYCFRWETAARRLSTELGRDIRPAYSAIDGPGIYWMGQIRYRPCFSEGYDFFVEYDTALGVPVHSWYQGFSEAQLRIHNYTDYRREATIKCWEIANQRIEGNNQDE